MLAQHLRALFMYLFYLFLFAYFPGKMIGLVWNTKKKVFFFVLTYFLLRSDMNYKGYI